METKTYWVGPYGVLIPSYIESVISDDGCNKYYSDGTETEMHGDSSEYMTLEQYRNKYAEEGTHGLWYWKDNNKK